MCLLCIFVVKTPERDLSIHLDVCGYLPVRNSWEDGIE